MWTSSRRSLRPMRARTGASSSPASTHTHGICAERRASMMSRNTDAAGTLLMAGVVRVVMISVTMSSVADDIRRP
jgi:hypothetical protein